MLIDEIYFGRKSIRYDDMMHSLSKDIKLGCERLVLQYGTQKGPRGCPMVEPYNFGLGRLCRPYRLEYGVSKTGIHA